MLVERALEVAPYDAVLVPTRGRTTARAVARSRAPVWVVAAGPEHAAMQGLAFSYGVHPVDLAEEPDDWRGYAERLLLELGLPCNRLLLVAGPSPQNPKANQRLELMIFEESKPFDGVPSPGGCGGVSRCPSICKIVVCQARS